MGLYHLVAVIVLNSGAFHWIAPPTEFEAKACNEVMDNVAAAAKDGVVLFAECYPVGEKTPSPLLAFRAPIPPDCSKQTNGVWIVGCPSVPLVGQPNPVTQP